MEKFNYGSMVDRRRFVIVKNKNFNPKGPGDETPPSGPPPPYPPEDFPDGP